MELIATDDFYILQPLQKGDVNLWVDRRSGKFEARPSWDLASQDNPECLGLVWALYGKFRPHPDLVERLVLVQRCERLGELPGRGFESHAVYEVERVVCVPISPEKEAVAQLGLKPCPKHQPHLGTENTFPF